MNKRLTIICGHYGSGKTNIALNLAMVKRKECDRVTVADLDIVNPYFRTKDSEQDLNDAGIRLICSDFANSNVDIPALPQDLYAITDDRDMCCILDIGGDDSGALALGRIAPAILEENDYDMLFVANQYRPLTRDVDSAMEVMREIEAACGIRFTGIVNNSNLGNETTPQDVLKTVPFAEQLSAASGLPVVMTTVSASLYPSLTGKIDGLFGLTLQKKL